MENSLANIINVIGEMSPKNKAALLRNLLGQCGIDTVKIYQCVTCGKMGNKSDNFKFCESCEDTYCRDCAPKSLSRHVYSCCSDINVTLRGRFTGIPVIRLSTLPAPKITRGDTCIIRWRDISSAETPEPTLIECGFTEGKEEEVYLKGDRIPKDATLTSIDKGDDGDNFVMWRWDSLSTLEFWLEITVNHN